MAEAPSTLAQAHNSTKALAPQANSEQTLAIATDFGPTRNHTRRRSWCCK